MCCSKTGQRLFLLSFQSGYCLLFIKVNSSQPLKQAQKRDWRRVEDLAYWCFCTVRANAAEGCPWEWSCLSNERPGNSWQALRCPWEIVGVYESLLRWLQKRCLASVRWEVWFRWTELHQKLDAYGLQLHANAELFWRPTEWVFLCREGYGTGLLFYIGGKMKQPAIKATSPTNSDIKR